MNLSPARRRPSPPWRRSGGSPRRCCSDTHTQTDRQTTSYVLCDTPSQRTWVVPIIGHLLLDDGQVVALADVVQTHTQTDRQTDYELCSIWHAVTTNLSPARRRPSPPWRRSGGSPRRCCSDTHTDRQTDYKLCFMWHAEPMNLSRARRRPSPPWRRSGGSPRRCCSDTHTDRQTDYELCSIWHAVTTNLSRARRRPSPPWRRSGGSPRQCCSDTYTDRQTDRLRAMFYVTRRANEPESCPSSAISSLTTVRW